MGAIARIEIDRLYRVPILQLPNFFHRCIGLILEVRQFHRLLSRRNRLDR